MSKNNPAERVSFSDTDQAAAGPDPASSEPGKIHTFGMCAQDGPPAPSTRETTRAGIYTFAEGLSSSSSEPWADYNSPAHMPERVYAGPEALTLAQPAQHIGVLDPDDTVTS